MYNVLLHHLSSLQSKPEFPSMFSSTMSAFCQSFELLDIELIRENIKRLELLNEKRKLFHQISFRYSFHYTSRNKLCFEHILIKCSFSQGSWLPMTKVIFLSLVNRRSDPLREHFIGILYRLAEIDFATFYQQVCVFFVCQSNFISDVKWLSTELFFSACSIVFCCFTTTINSLFQCSCKTFQHSQMNNDNIFFTSLEQVPINQLFPWISTVLWSTSVISICVGIQHHNSKTHTKSTFVLCHVSSLKQNLLFL